VIDVDKRLVIWNDKGRKAEVLDRYYAGIGEEGCQRIEGVLKKWFFAVIARSLPPFDFVPFGKLREGEQSRTLRVVRLSNRRRRDGTTKQSLTY